MALFEKTIARAEALLKGMVFDCQSCGQCVLRQTGLICPMTCPKGLRNGPCGGTLNGECEVFPDKPCVWVRIRKRTGGHSLELPDLLPSADARLFNTSSYLNFFSGEDRHARTPLPYLDLGAHRTGLPVRTASHLEALLKSGAFVKTCEIRSPRSNNFTSFLAQAALVRPHFHAVNATAFLNGKPSMPSPVASQKLVDMGIDAICQSTCRDHTKTSFVSELIQNQANNVHNILCLTGDSYASVPKIKQVFDMDAALMIYEARHLQHTGIVRFTGEKLPSPPQPFLGGAINPFTNPLDVPIRRLKQKAAAGVDFIQTQLIFDVPGFARFMEVVRQEHITDDLFILAGVPVVISRNALAMLTKIPGVHLLPQIMQRLESAADIRAEGLALAREIARGLAAIPGVSGLHLMLFGPDHAVLPSVIEGLSPPARPAAQTNVVHLPQASADYAERQPCPSLS